MDQPEEKDGIEIIDFYGEKLSLINIRYSTIFFVFVILAVIWYLIFLGFLPFPMEVFVVLGILIIVILFVANSLSTRGMLRRFFISDLLIEFLLPPMDQFTIYWNDFNKIKVTLKILNIKPFNIYNIKFIGKNQEKVINVGLQDFKKEKIKEILNLLKTHAKIHKKQFNATKEKIVSGIYIVDDLEI